MSAFVNAVAIPTITMLAAIGLTVPTVASASPATQDPLQRKVESLALQGEYFVDGIAKLNSLEKDVGFTIEFLSGTKNSPPHPDPMLTARVADATVRDVLNWLCQLDPRYTWKRDGNMVNFIPRDALRDPNYLFNRILPSLSFVKLLRATDGLEPIFKPICKTGESVISLTDPGNFSKPWSAEFQTISVRDALDRLATQLGPGHGWMVYGNHQTKIISFYSSLMTKAEAERKKKGVP